VASVDSIIAPLGPANKRPGEAADDVRATSGQLFRLTGRPVAGGGTALFPRSDLLAGRVRPVRRLRWDW